MPNADRLRKKLDKKIIKRFGALTNVFRYNLGDTSNPFYPDTKAEDSSDIYGEPIKSDGSLELEFKKVFINNQYRIAVEFIGYDEYSSSVGGLALEKKEKLRAYISSGDDLRIGDKVEWPKDSHILFDVVKSEPFFLNDVNVIVEFEAHRDPRNYLSVDLGY